MSITRIVQLCLVAVLALGIGMSGALLPASRAAAAPSLTLSRANAASGDHVVATAYGFTGGDDVVISADLTVSGKAQHLQTATTAGGNGVASATLTIPKGTNQGTYQIVARDFHNHSATHNINVLPNAGVTAGSNGHTTWVLPGSRFYVSGSGFAANETVTIRAEFPLYNGNTTTVTRTRQTDGSGVFYESVLPVPMGAKAGSATLTVTGQQSNKTGKGTLHVFYHPTVALAADTYRPGTAIHVTGAGYVPGSNIQVGVTIPRTNNTNETISRNVSANGNGKFSAYLPLPNATKVGTYTVTARETDTGFHASTKVKVSVNPTISVNPDSGYPGQSIKVTGSNFGSGVTVRVVGQFPGSNGNSITARRSAHANRQGAYSVNLPIPGNAQPGSATITARTSNGNASTHVQVMQKPTPVPKATATSTATPNPTATQVPATSTPKPTATPTQHKHHNKPPKLGYKWISVWYHTMREGTREHIIVQSTINTTQGIWVHVWFPAHQHYAYFQNTDSHGQWSIWFTVPNGSIAPGNSQALVTFRLWHGKDNVKEFRHFKIIR